MPRNFFLETKHSNPLELTHVLKLDPSSLTSDTSISFDVSSSFRSSTMTEQDITLTLLVTQYTTLLYARNFSVNVINYRRYTDLWISRVILSAYKPKYLMFVRFCFHYIIKVLIIALCNSLLGTRACQLLLLPSCQEAELNIIQLVVGDVWSTRRYQQLFLFAGIIVKYLQLTKFLVVLDRNGSHTPVENHLSQPASYSIVRVQNSIP